MKNKSKFTEEADKAKPTEEVFFVSFTLFFIGFG
jgi:hypothetical protein